MRQNSDDDAQPRGRTRRELRAMDRRFRQAMAPPNAEQLAELRRAAAANKIPLRYMQHDLILKAGHDITIEQVLTWTATAAANYQRDRYSTHAWRGPDSYIIPPLDGPGYMDIPDDVDATTLTPAEYLAGVQLGWLQRPDAWMAQVSVIPAAMDSFLAKLVTTD